MLLSARKVLIALMDDSNLDVKTFKTLEGGINFDRYTFEILSDAVDSIARVWLHIWSRYRNWIK